jgi:hypothetical protein
VLLIKITSIIISIIIFTEDMRSRSVHWFWFPMLAIVLIALRCDEAQAASEIMATTAFNIAFLIIQMLLVTLYFSIKQQKLINITEGLLGWGDILFVLSIAFYFSFLNFIVFYVISLVVVLISWLTYIRLVKNEQHIPLAGLQSVLFTLLLIVGCFNRTINLTNDDLLIKLINP